MKATIVIPARLASTRLPRKVLADLAGRPMLWHVWNRARQVSSASMVLVATDSHEVAAAVDSWGGQSVMTSPACRSGTDRIASIAESLPGGLIINVQGDEPLMDPMLLERLIAVWHNSPCDVITPVYKIASQSELENPSIVKVVRTATGKALYFSRSPVPYLRDTPPASWPVRHSYWGHVGIYGYRRDVLLRFPHLPASDLEKAESLEQLRLLEAGCTIQTVECAGRTPAIDTPEDLAEVRRLMREGQPV